MSGISGIEGQISLAFSSLSSSEFEERRLTSRVSLSCPFDSVAAIVLSPESAPSSLFTNLLQVSVCSVTVSMSTHA